MILLIDNYDSFSYNLYQLLGSVREDIRVIRNDQMTVEEIEAMNPDAIILSPGPGRPADAGIIEQAARHFAGSDRYWACAWATRQSARPLAAKWATRRR
jgi:anthranilate synthase component 2